VAAPDVSTKTTNKNRVESFLVRRFAGVLGGPALGRNYWGGGVGLLVGLAWRRWRRKPAPLTGLAATLAAPLAMAVTRPIQSTVWAGLGLLVLSGVAFLGPADFRSWCFSRCFLVPYGEALTPAALLDRISSSIGRGITQRASDWC
jgi:hypothetical protein